MINKSTDDFSRVPEDLGHASAVSDVSALRRYCPTVVFFYCRLCGRVSVRVRTSGTPRQCRTSPPCGGTVRRSFSFAADCVAVCPLFGLCVSFSGVCLGKLRTCLFYRAAQSPPKGRWESAPPRRAESRGVRKAVHLQKGRSRDTAPAGAEAQQRFPINKAEQEER